MIHFNDTKTCSEEFRNMNYHLIQLSCGSCEFELLFVF